MEGPRTYFEWIMLLDKFANGEDDVIESLELGVLDMDKGNFVRMSNKIEETYRYRKKIWLDKFNRRLSINNLKYIDDYEILLNEAKQNLQPIKKFISIKPFSLFFTEVLKEDFVQFVDEIRNSLIRNFSKEGKESENMILIFKSFTVGDFEKNTLLENTKKKIDSINTVPLTGRKIIF